MIIVEPTAEQLREMRERTGLGFEECKKIFLKERLLIAIDIARTMEDIKPILYKLVRNM